MQKLLTSREEVAVEAVHQLLVVDLGRVSNKSGFLSSIVKRVEFERAAGAARPGGAAHQQPLSFARQELPGSAGLATLDAVVRRAAGARNTASGGVGGGTHGRTGRCDWSAAKRSRPLTRDPFSSPLSPSFVPQTRLWPRARCGTTTSTAG